MTAVLDVLRQNGIAVLPDGLTMEQAGEIHDYLRGRPCYTKHVKVYSDGVPRSFDEVSAVSDVWCHDMADTIQAPHLWEFALSQIPLMRDYLGALPRLYSLNAFWSKAGPEVPDPAIQAWHRDNDDTRFCAVFLYGTDVIADQYGPHRFRRGTQVGGGQEDGPELAVYGMAGTAFAANTHGMHMGGKPQSGQPRLLLWARFGISDPPESYVWDKLEPAPADLLGERYPADPELREIVKLVAR
jgi:hypothetical protein